MATLKDEILAAIRREAAANGGVPPGKVKFARATGIKESAWVGRYWARWGDALLEAGFKPNLWQSAKEDEEGLVRHLAGLTLRLGHYPVGAERKMHRTKDPDFPASNTLDTRLGDRNRQLKLLRDFALAHVEFAAVYDMVAPLIPGRSPAPTAKQTSLGVVGSVYLMKSGEYYKIGRSNHVGRRAYEVALQLPEKLVVEHEIETDDPEGLERYWHQRFATRRKNGEWFLLSSEDIAAFKRRKSFM